MVHSNLPLKTIDFYMDKQRNHPNLVKNMWLIEPWLLIPPSCVFIHGVWRDEHPEIPAILGFTEFFSRFWLIYIYISIPYQITKYIGRNYACYFPMNWYFNIGIITIGMSSGMNKWFQSIIAVDCRYNIRLLIITVCACMCMYTYIYICTPFDLSQFLPIGITIYYSTISTIY